MNISEHITVASMLTDLPGAASVADAARELRYNYLDLSSDSRLQNQNRAARLHVLVLSLDGEPDRSLILHQALRHEFSPVCVVYLAEQARITDVVRAMKLGAFSVISPRIEQHELMRLLLSAAETHRVRAAWMEDIKTAQRRIGALSGRQREVLARVIAGNTNKAIGSQLHITTKTVEKHRRLIYQRTEAQSLPELVRLDFISRRSLEAAYSMNAASRPGFSATYSAAGGSQEVLRQTATCCGIH